MPILRLTLREAPPIKTALQLFDNAFTRALNPLWGFFYRALGRFLIWEIPLVGSNAILRSRVFSKSHLQNGFSLTRKPDSEIILKAANCERENCGFYFRMTHFSDCKTFTAHF